MKRERKFKKQPDGSHRSLAHAGHESVSVVIEPVKLWREKHRDDRDRFHLFLEYRGGQQRFHIKNERGYTLYGSDGAWSLSSAKYWGSLYLSWSFKSEWRTRTFGEETN